jgi:hypothetical protein
MRRWILVEICDMGMDKIVFVVRDITPPGAAPKSSIRECE